MADGDGEIVVVFAVMALVGCVVVVVWLFSWMAREFWSDVQRMRDESRKEAADRHAAWHAELKAERDQREALLELGFTEQDLMLNHLVLDDERGWRTVEYTFPHDEIAARAAEVLQRRIEAARGEAATPAGV